MWPRLLGRSRVSYSRQTPGELNVPTRACQPRSCSSDGKLFALAPLEGVKAALDEKRPVKVLALGSPAMSALGTGSASYPAWLEHELERLLPRSQFRHGAPPHVGRDHGGRIGPHQRHGGGGRPDLVIWKVGTAEVLARTDTEEFARSLDDTVKWLKEHDIEVVLVDPQYTASLQR